MGNLNTKAWLSLVCLAIALGLLLFVPAGTTDYWQAWLFLAVFLTASALHTAYLINHDQALLARRLRGGPWAEQATAQKIIMLFISMGFLALLVVPALDRRFGWSAVPPILVIAGDVLIAVGYYIVFLVFRENSFSSATVEISKEQKVVSTGPYALVRHPMYAGALLYCFGIPLALGSYWGLLALAAMMPFFAWRIIDEEKLLAANLPGYRDYCARVRYRLVPRLF